MAFSIVILSKNIDNLKACVGSVLQNEPRARIIVVDDGLEYEYTAYPMYIPGEKPFIFSRNANIGIHAAGTDDVILLNDDTRLLTPNGFTHLHDAAVRHPEYGILSASIQGFVGNPEQNNAGTGGIRPALLHTLAFVCVHIPRTVLNQLGPLEERLIHYGWDDNLYCLQARAAGYKLGVYDGCVVEHGALPSTYRNMPGISAEMDANQKIFEGIVREKGLEKFWPVPFRF